MTKNAAYIAAFDLDKTLLSVNSSRLLVKLSRKSGLMSTRDYWQAIYYSIVYKFDLKDAQNIVQEMIGWLRGVAEKDVIDTINTQAIPILSKLIRPEMEKEIKIHQENNAHVILLSSAMPYLCNPIAEKLGMNAVISSQLEIKEGKFTGKSIRNLVFGKEKAVRMLEYCREKNYSLEDAWYYGDAYTDRYILKEVGNPVCVKPEIKLGMMARRKGWQII